MSNGQASSGQSTAIPYTPVAPAINPPLYVPDGKPVVVNSTAIPHGYSYIQPQLTTPMVPVVHRAIEASDSPMQCTCPHCHASVQTTPKYKAGTLTYVASLIGCLVICCVGALIPFCGNCLKDAEHYCPKCGKFIAKYKREL